MCYIWNNLLHFYSFVGFTGQLDHLQGDALNQRVRATASVSYKIYEFQLIIG